MTRAALVAGVLFAGVLFAGCMSSSPPATISTSSTTSPITGSVGSLLSSLPGGTPNEKAAQQVQEYFAGKGARYVESLAVENIRVTNEARGRTLSLRFVSNGSDRADGSLSSLYYMSISDDGWTAELNQVGLNLAWVIMEFDYPDGSREVLEIDISGHGIAGSTRLRPGPPTTP